MTNHEENVKEKDVKGTHNRKKALAASALRILFAVIFLWVILVFVNTSYMFQAPGTCEDVSGYISVIGGKKVNTTGRFYLTTVYYERANVLLWLWAKVDPAAQLIEKDKSEQDATDEERNEIMKEQMNLSQLKSKVAAFRALGYEVPVKKEAVEIVKVNSWSRAGGELKKGDLILEVNGVKTGDDTEMVKVIENLKEDDRPELVIERNNEKLKVKVPVVKKDGKIRIGVIIKSYFDGVELPDKVIFDTKNVIGASAGLMFTLEIMRQASGIDLTGGNQIAGTGAIDQNGKVLPIKGAKFKVLTAKDAGVKHFLVPKENFDEAQKALTKKDNMKIYSVANLQDALKVLKKLNSSADVEKYKKRIIMENQKKRRLSE